jgi:hypothetical protein
MKAKKCVECGRRLEWLTPNRKFCSSWCRDQREWKRKLIARRFGYQSWAKLTEALKAWDASTMH